MGNKIIAKGMITLVLSTLFVLNTYADEVCNDGFEGNSTINESIVLSCDSTIGANFDATDGASVEVNGNLELDGNADIAGDLIVHGNLILHSNITIGGNLIVEGDIKGKPGNIDVMSGYIKAHNISLGSNADTKQIISTGDVELGGNSDITDGVITDGYLKTGSNFTLQGLSIIRGDFVTEGNFDADGILYVYGNLVTGSNYTFEGNKLKVTKRFYTEGNGDNKGKIYIYGKKDTGANYNEYKKNLSYLIGEIDPLLIYNLSNEKFTQVKNKTIKSDKKIYHSKSDAKKLNFDITALKKEDESREKKLNNQSITTKINQLNIIKNNSINEYEELFNFIDLHIENEDFDIDLYNKIKTERLMELKNLFNSMYGNKVDVSINTITKKVIIKKEVIKKEEKISSSELDNFDGNFNNKNEEDYEEVVKEKVEEKKETKEVKSELSLSIIIKLDRALSKITESKREATYLQIVKKINTMLEENTEKIAIENKPLLLGIIQYLKNDLIENKVIKSIGL